MHGGAEQGGPGSGQHSPSWHSCDQVLGPAQRKERGDPGRCGTSVARSGPTSPWGLPRPHVAADASACPAQLSPMPVQYSSAPFPTPTVSSPGKLLSSCRNAKHEPFYLNTLKQLVHEICFYRNPYRCQPSAARHGRKVNHPSLPTGEGQCAQTQPVIPAAPRAPLPSPSAAVGLWPSDQAQPGPLLPARTPSPAGHGPASQRPLGCRHGLPRVSEGGCGTKGTQLPASSSPDTTSCSSTLGNTLLLYFCQLKRFAAISVTCDEPGDRLRSWLWPLKRPSHAWTLGQGTAGPSTGSAAGPSAGARCRAAGASSAQGMGQAGPSPAPRAVGCREPGDRSWGDALPEAQHSPGRRDRAASPPAQRQFYKK